MVMEVRPGQRVLPGFREALGVGRDVIPAANVANLRDTELLFGVEDLVRVGIELGMFKTAEQARFEIGKFRKTYQYASDAVAGVIMISNADGYPEARIKFEEKYDCSLNTGTLPKALGGCHLNLKQANFSLK